MQHEAWHSRWREGRIGFHEGGVNAFLRTLWPLLECQRGERVLVPLCGAAVDLRWLVARGHPVLGVELSRIAVQRVFDEAKMEPRVHRCDAFEIFGFGELEVWRGDFFDLVPRHTLRPRAFYDRASLVALSPDVRGRYATHLRSLLAPNARGLLVSLEYDAGSMQGPPFSVGEDEVRDLFGGSFDIELAAREDPLPEALRGARNLVESAYCLRPRVSA